MCQLWYKALLYLHFLKGWCNLKDPLHLNLPNTVFFSEFVKIRIIVRHIQCLVHTKLQDPKDQKYILITLGLQQYPIHHLTGNVMISIWQIWYIFDNMINIKLNKLFTKFYFFLYALICSEMIFPLKWKLTSEAKDKAIPTWEGREVSKPMMWSHVAITT